MLTLTAAAAALALGSNGQTVTSVDHEKSLSTSDIVIAADDTATNGNQNSSQKNDNAKGSAKMGEEEGTQTGANQGATPEKDSQKIDQPARKNPTTSN